MRLPLAAALSLLPALALAEPSPISAEIAATGLAATEARLAALAEPTPADLFALAGLHFLSGVESALQLRWQTGVQADWSELPILRLPIPENPAARPFSGADLTTLLTGLDADMDSARTALKKRGQMEDSHGLSSSSATLLLDPPSRWVKAREKSSSLLSFQGSLPSRRLRIPSLSWRGVMALGPGVMES